MGQQDKSDDLLSAIMAMETAVDDFSDAIEELESEIGVMGLNGKIYDRLNMLKHICQSVSKAYDDEMMRDAARMDAMMYRGKRLSDMVSAWLKDLHSPPEHEWPVNSN